MKIGGSNVSATPIPAKAVISVLVCLVVAGCSGAPAKKDSSWAGQVESGKASYYGAKFQSQRTASGELYDEAKKTAAHRKLPFGTKIKVTNIKNGRSVIVKVNDRGPFVKGRIVDLSKAAFSAIANLSAGVVDVSIEVIK